MESMAQQYIDPVIDVFSSMLTLLAPKMWFSALFAVGGLLFSADAPMILSGIIVLVIFDTVTGVMGAWMRRERVESRRLLRGAFKLVVYAMLLSAAYITDVIAGFAGNTWLSIEYAVASFLAATEFVSIVENTGKMGYVVPKKLLNQLEIFRIKK